MTLSIVDVTEGKSFILLPCVDSRVLFKDSILIPPPSSIIDVTVLCVAQSSVTLEDLAFAFAARKGSHADFCLQALLSPVWCLTISSSTSFFLQRTQQSEASTAPSVLCVKQKMTGEQPSTPLRGQAKCDQRSCLPRETGL